MKYLGCFILNTIVLALLAAGAVYLWANCVMDHSKEAADKAVRAIVTTWDVEEFYTYADPEMFKRGEADTEKLKQLFTALQSFGTVKNVKPAIGDAQAIVPLNGTARKFVARYVVEVEFDKGPATFTVTLLKQAKDWKITVLDITSPLVKVNDDAAPEEGADNVPVEPIEPAQEQPEEAN